MKRQTGTAIGITVLALLTWAAVARGQAQIFDDDQQDAWAPASSAPLWPYRFDVDGETFTVYPPQLERWTGNRLEGRAAVAVQPEDAERPVFGIVSLTARTQVDEASGTVTVRDIDAASGSFPTATDRASAYLEEVRSHLSRITWEVAVERLRADLAIDQTTRQSWSEPLRNDAPRIVYSQSPAILVPIDGEPVLREMPGLGLRRVLNTRALILRDEMTRRYFLSAAGYWLEASSLAGPWEPAQVRPMALEEAKRRAADDGEVDLLEDSEGAVERAPKVIVSTTPTELVQTDGPPEYLPIPYTELLYVGNSPNRLFLDPSTQHHYLLLSGRWYRTHSLQKGPWEYVSGLRLPADFARIPQTHPTAGVRAAVPGTPQAQEAAIASSVPEVATIRRSAAQLESTYDGPPQFEPIEETTLEWAVNAPIPVIRVDWRNYYALDNGVWFFAESPHGPWSAAAWVPAIVYTIPRSHPLHYVTYVRVYDSTGEEITVGYTSGYAGSFVTADSTVVFGSGWYYRPWIGNQWYAPHVTWGFGFSTWYSWWYPSWWYVKPVLWRPYPCYRPSWGPWHHHRAVATRHDIRVKPAASSVAGGSWPAPKSVAPARRADVGHIYHRWSPRVAAAHGPGAIHGPRSDVPSQRTDAARTPERRAASSDRMVRRGMPPRFNEDRRFDDGRRRDNARPEWSDTPRSRRRDRVVLAPAPASEPAPDASAPRTGDSVNARPRAVHEPRREFPRQRDVRPDWKTPRPALSAPAPTAPRAVRPAPEPARSARVTPGLSLREASPPAPQGPSGDGRYGRALAPQQRGANSPPWVGQQRN